MGRGSKGRETQIKKIYSVYQGDAIGANNRWTKTQRRP